MNGSVLSKLEIDVMQVNEIQEATELALKYKLPSLVVHPGLSSDAIIAKSRANAKFKIITPIDWPKGEVFGVNKMRNLLIDSLETDGFEILLTPGKYETETRNEAKLITEFIKKHLSDTVEVRFVLGCYTRDEENIATMCRGLLTIRTPALIRTDINNKLPVAKANTEEHIRYSNKILSIIKAPIKISGNINNLKNATSCDAFRLGVNLTQAKTIIKEFNAP